MPDSEINTQPINFFMFEFKRLMVLCILFLVTVVFQMIVGIIDPQTFPLSYFELQETLPPVFLAMYVITQVTSLLLIFLTGYFLAEYRIMRRTRRCQIVEDRSIVSGEE